MNVLILGNPFGHLINEMKANDVRCDVFAYESMGEAFVSDYSVIICVGLNLSLNNSQSSIFLRVLTESSPNARVIMWTHEPFWDAAFMGQDKSRVLFGREVSFYNAYSGNVYFSPYSHYFGIGGYLWSQRRINRVDTPEKSFLEKRFKEGKYRSQLTCAYATCFHDSRLKMKGSIVESRNNLIYSMNKNDRCDVFGKNWKGRWGLEVKGESRAGMEIDGEVLSWGAVKVNNVRENYSFSVCLENCLIDYYVTEKLGQAIEAWTLPIYVIGNKLEEFMSLDGGLFYDLEELDSNKVMATIDNMSFDEYFDRLESVTDSYNNAIKDAMFINEQRVLPARSLVLDILS